MLVSIIVTTYNWPKALEFCLAALNCQSNKNFEVIIADDGSRQETTNLIISLQNKYNFKIIHIWQEDNGFQAAKIRNKSIAAANGELIAFLDGDCIPLPNFVDSQLILAEKGYFVVGNRVLLSKEFTHQVLDKNLLIHEWSVFAWLVARFKGHCNRLQPFFKLPYPRKFQPKKWKGAKGCNICIWKDDLVAINGWDESFIGWGYEDSDLVVRLIKHGIKRKEGKFKIPVIHLWHKENPRDNEQENWQKLQDVIRSDHVVAHLGVSQYL